MRTPRKVLVFAVVIFSIFGLAELTCQTLGLSVRDWRRLAVYPIFGFFGGFFGAKANHLWTRRSDRKRLERQFKPAAECNEVMNQGSGKSNWILWPLSDIAQPGPWLKGGEILIDGRKGRIVDQLDMAIKVEWFE